MKSNYLLLKAFTISLFIHIAGFSLFSIVFPLPSPSRKPIEVSLLPPAMDKKIQLEKTDIIPELPVLKTRFENIASFDRREIIKISKRVFTGSSNYVPLTKIADTFKIPEFKIKFPFFSAHSGYCIFSLYISFLSPADPSIFSVDFSFEDKERVFIEGKGGNFILNSGILNVSAIFVRGT